MNKINIAAIAPYEGLQNSLRAAATHFSEYIEVDIIAGNLEECIQYMHLFSVKRYDIIISRGGTAKYLHEITTIPVIEIEISAYDMLHAIKAAEQLTEHFFVVGFPQIVGIAKMVRDILQYSFEILEINSEAEARAVLEKIHQANPKQFIIGDTVTVHLATDLGMPNQLIISGKESVEKAYRDAIQYFSNLSSVRFDRDIFRSILNNLDSSIIVYASDRQLFYHNMDLRQNDCFFIFDYTKTLIDRLHDADELNFIKKFHRHLFQIHGKRLDMGERAYFIFTIARSSGKLLQDNFFFIEEEAEDDFKVLKVRTALMGKIERVLPLLKGRNVPLHISGAFGTDADSVARYLHKQIWQDQSSMISINCRFLNPKNWNMLIENESSPIHALHYSIYFKDIHLLSTEMQLLIDNYISDTALNTRCFLLSSTTQQMDRLIERGEFFASLYQKLSNIHLCIPSVNEYPEEIPAIAQSFIGMYNEQLGKDVIGFERSALEIMKNQYFHHNLRQIEQTVKQLVLLLRRLLYHQG